MHVYDQKISQHYAAYRPPLHEQIIGKALPGQTFDVGLDIGCGTGCSTLALANHCTHTIGVDNSRDMIERAIIHPRIEYRHGAGDDLPIEDNSIGVVTLAGVLPYLNFEKIVVELVRVSRSDAYILTYDFEVSMQELMTVCDLPIAERKSAYDHSRDLSDASAFRACDQVFDTVELQVDDSQAAHLLLSSDRRHNELEAIFETNDPYSDVLSRLERSKWSNTLSAKTFHTLHQLR